MKSCITGYVVFFGCLVVLTDWCQLIQDHLKEMFSVIYTPTEGDAIQNYSRIFRKPEGCFLNIRDQDRIEEDLKKFTDRGKNEDVDYIVVTDGEEVSFSSLLQKKAKILIVVGRFWALETKAWGQCLFQWPSLS